MKNFKRILAICVVVIILSLYILGMIFAIQKKNDLTMACITAATAVAIIGWGISSVTRYLNRRNEILSLKEQEQQKADAGKLTDKAHQTVK